MLRSTAAAAASRRLHRTLAHFLLLRSASAAPAAHAAHAAVRRLSSSSTSSSSSSASSSSATPAAASFFEQYAQQQQQEAKRAMLLQLINNANSSSSMMADIKSSMTDNSTPAAGAGTAATLRSSSSMSSSAAAIRGLLECRKDLLTMISNSKRSAAATAPATAAAMRSLDDSLLLLQKNVVFSPEMLLLHEFSWHPPSPAATATPAAAAQDHANLLQLLYKHETVQPLQRWEDLKYRLSRGRRIFGLFQRNLGGYPLCFINVALTQELNGEIAPVIDEQRRKQEAFPEDLEGQQQQQEQKQQKQKEALQRAEEAERRATHAIFYSINTVHDGLAGVGLGTLLIKRVAERLQQQFPALHTFSTLSPIPGFDKWLRTMLQKRISAFERAPATALPPFLSAEETFTLRKMIPSSTCDSSMEALLRVLDDPVRAKGDNMKPMLTRLCARYVAAEKVNGKLIDPVANFHVSNGAIVARINWQGDTSERAWRSSLGFMANYQYDLAQLQSNATNYRLQGIVPTSAIVAALLAPPASSQPSSL